jgi:hypothetical protein
MPCVTTIVQEVCLSLVFDVFENGGLVSQEVECGTCPEDSVFDPVTGRLTVTIPFTVTGTLTVDDNLGVNFNLDSIIITEPVPQT